MIRRGWMEPGWRKVLTVRVRGYALDADDIPAVALPAADFDRLLALLEECAEEVEANTARRVRALLKEVGDE